MGRAIERIEQEIETLKQVVTATAEEFDQVYSGYLVALGQAVRQQLILATYHLCTQGYPEPFLNLSLNQRYQLQSSLRELAGKGQKQLSESRERAAKVAKPLKPEPQVIYLPLSTSEAEPESALQEPASAGEPRVLAQFTLGIDEELPAEPIATSHPPQTPEELIQWQERIERLVVEQLQDSSRAANLLLQQMGILPKKLPEPVLEVAAKADVGSDALASYPNLINLVVETPVDEVPGHEASGSGSNKRVPIPVTMVHLRLTEVEFADPQVMGWRSKIRNLSSRIKQLSREYQQKQRERAIALAESAWKTIWSDG